MSRDAWREWRPFLTSYAVLVFAWVIVAYAIPYLLGLRKPPKWEVR